MKYLNLYIALHVLICLAISLFHWSTKWRYKKYNVYTVAYAGIMTLVFTYFITDTLLDFVYVSVFAICSVWTIQLLSKELKRDYMLPIIGLTFVTSALFAFISHYVLVKILSLIMVYFYPSLFLRLEDKSLSFKSKVVGALSLSIILISGFYFNSSDSNPYQTKQSHLAETYLQEVLPNKDYSIQSIDSSRGKSTTVTVYHESLDEVLRLEYKKGRLVEMK